jgi:hypothetical protein
MRALLTKATFAFSCVVVALAAHRLSYGQAAYGGGYGQGGYGQGGYGQGGGGGYGGGGYGGSGGYGQTSAFGGGVGGGFGNASGGMGSGFGQSGMFSGGMGGSAFGQSGGMGGGAFGQGGMKGNGMAGGNGQQQGMGGQRNFIGRDATEVTNTFQTQFGSPQQGGGGFGEMLQGFNEMREQRRRWRDRQNAPPPVKVQLRPAFDLPMPGAVTAEAVSGLQTRVNEVLATRGTGAGAVQVAATPQALVLTGSVGSEHDRRLIAVLASLEPGIGPIDNRLTVATAGAPSQSAAAPAGAPPEVVGPASASVAPGSLR